ncbi:MAG: hypothetical protein H6R10_611 [Rhodocyclaceae bacterium]|nr:hypothetical protein [Rhodocyclaceae bacterium]
MQVKSNFQVVGAKAFNGEVEGKRYDSTTLFVLMDVSERSGTAIGQNVVEMKFGKSDEFDKMKHLPFPVQAELTLNLTTKGYEVEGFRPVAQAKTPAQV